MLKKIGLVTIFLTVTIIFSGCASKELIRPAQAEIDAYLEANPELPDKDKKCINEANLEIGIRAETVRFMLGEPKTIEQVKQPWAHQEHWMYKRGKTRIFIIEDKHVVGIEER